MADFWKKIRGVLFSFCFMIAPPLFISCAPFQQSNNIGPAVPTTATNDAVKKEAPLAKAEAPVEARPKAPQDIENLTIDEVIRIEEPNTQTLYDNSRYDFPITVNSRVEGWIDYFTGRGRPHMERYLSRSAKYIPVMKQILRKNGVPEDLVYLALIESGFNMRAKSSARAVGPWQFIKGTGKRYGLRVDAWVDERRDPLKSTEAAGKYLKDLFLMFESWYLAASAYNAGEYKIMRAIDDVKTHNFWRMCQTHALKRETKDYIPKLIAAAIIAKNPARYGFEDVSYEEPLEFEVVSVDFPIQLKDIASLVEASEEDLADLNPQLARGVVPPSDEPFEVRVPVGSRVLVERALIAMRSHGPSPIEMPQEHIVKAGESLAQIARRYHVRVNDLISTNNLGKRERLVAGTSLVIPKGGRSADMAALGRVKRAVGTIQPGSQPEATVAGDDRFIVHVVRKGESLWSISEKYSVTIQDIFKWNNLRKSQIKPGKRLKIRSDQTTTDEAEIAHSRPLRTARSN
jgi:membrane-bound lytic murein transglycosylase D